MRHLTNDLYERYCSGDTVNEISDDTGISTDALYKRFQRMQKLSQDKSTDIKPKENPTPGKDKPQPDASKWKEGITALMVFASVIIGFFMYRKYFSQRNLPEETK